MTLTAPTMTAPTITALARTTAELPCRAEPQLFFAEDPQDLLRAKVLCRSCPVRLACLTDALRRREPCGVWGGEQFDRGAVIAGKRPRGRPRKAAATRRESAA